jgi:hypothetical protein
VSESTRTSAAVEPQPFQEGTGRASARIDHNVRSEREPEAPTGNLPVDPLDPELNVRRHPSAWRLWAARMELWHTERASGPTVATAQPTVVEPRALQVWFPQLKPFTGAEGDVDRFFGASSKEDILFRRLSRESAAGCLPCFPPVVRPR